MLVCAYWHEEKKMLTINFIVEERSFEIAHSKLKIIPGKKIVVCGISTKRRKFPNSQFSNFLRLN